MQRMIQNKKLKKILLLLIGFFFTVLTACEVEPPQEETTYTLRVMNTVNNTTEEFTFKDSSIMVANIQVTFINGYDYVGLSTSILEEDLLDLGDRVDLTTTTTLYSLWEKIKDEPSEENNPFIIDDIGEIRLTVQDAITSKETYCTGTISIKSETYQLSDTPFKIRLRGNSSLSAPKKSYKVKFEEKQDVFGFGKDKEWALIANYYDSSLLRNYYAYKFAQAMGIDYSVDCKLVEVYLNDVDQGLYLFTETVKTGKNRVDIECDYTASDTEIPFLLELDMKMISEGDPTSNGIKDVDYFTLDISHYKFSNYAIATKYPDTFSSTDITQAQYDYIKNYVKEAFNSVKTEDYTNYFDQASVIDYFLLQELFMNIDQDYSSVYFYKEKNGLIHYGPVWDFDISLGNANYYDRYDAYMKMSDITSDGYHSGSYVFYNLMEHEAFYNAFMKRLNEIEPIINQLSESINPNYNIIKDYAKNDNALWNTLNRAFWPKPSTLVGLSYREHLAYIQNFIENHYSWMKENM